MGPTDVEELPLELSLSRINDGDTELEGVFESETAVGVAERVSGVREGVGPFEGRGVTSADPLTRDAVAAAVRLCVTAVRDAVAVLLQETRVGVVVDCGEFVMLAEFCERDDDGVSLGDAPVESDAVGVPLFEEVAEKERDVDAVGVLLADAPLLSEAVGVAAAEPLTERADVGELDCEAPLLIVFEGVPGDLLMLAVPPPVAVGLCEEPREGVGEEDTLDDVGAAVPDFDEEGVSEGDAPFEREAEDVALGMVDPVSEGVANLLSVVVGLEVRGAEPVPLGEAPVEMVGVPEAGRRELDAEFVLLGDAPRERVVVGETGGMRLVEAVGDGVLVPVSVALGEAPLERVAVGVTGARDDEGDAGMRDVDGVAREGEELGEAPRESVAVCDAAAPVERDAVGVRVPVAWGED